MQKLFTFVVIFVTFWYFWIFQVILINFEFIVLFCTSCNSGVKKINYVHFTFGQCIFASNANENMLD